MASMGHSELNLCLQWPKKHSPKGAVISDGMQLQYMIILTQFM